MTETQAGYDEDGHYVDVLLPGFIEANAGCQFGSPCLAGTRIPFYVGLGWVWEKLDNPRWRRGTGLTRERVIALAAFHAGYEWHQSRKRRKKMDEEVTKLWERINAEGGDQHAARTRLPEGHRGKNSPPGRGRAGKPALPGAPGGGSSEESPRRGKRTEEWECGSVRT